ncbi:MAG: peptidyl-prolyl cis-trans isomerase [Proteobacteria bacterium]|nr:MAG: peptidyl-prolyl cis-trans isomerase [Pseudomonadota bacterium]
MPKYFACIFIGLSTLLQAACPEDKAYPNNMFPELDIETSLGSLTVELDRLKAPLTVNHLLHLIKNKRYDNTLIHRVVPGFVIQAGAFTSDLDEVKTCGTVVNESGNGLKNTRGSLSMARYNDPHSAASSFFINLGENNNLDPSADGWGYAVFGYITAGMDVVDKIAAVQTHYNEQLDAKDVPVKNLKIISIQVKQ